MATPAQIKIGRKKLEGLGMSSDHASWVTVLWLRGTKLERLIAIAEIAKFVLKGAEGD